MNARERVQAALNHRQPDRTPLDLGASAVTGMHVSSVYLLRQALRLDPPGTPVKVVEPYQLLGEIQADLMDALGVDVVGLPGPRTLFGFANTGWKPWTTPGGTPVLVPEGFNTVPEENGDLLMYPEGDRSAPPSGRMPKDGFYFDSIVRQPLIDESRLDPADNLEEFGPLTPEDLDYFTTMAEHLWQTSERAILANFGGTAFGDIALVPAPWLKHPKGIRDIEEWYMSTLTRRDYIWKVFEKQCEIGLANLERLHGAVGEKVCAVFVSGTDFGTQSAPFISPKTYRQLYQPFHRQVNDWIHAHTTWKSFIHSCGSVYQLIPDFIASGFDILNPVQISAVGMDPTRLKREFGRDLVFWGGGIDTQQVLPFGSAEEVGAAARESLRIFGEGGGYVFNTVHNVQAGVPVENLLALYEAVNGRKI